MGLLDAFKAMDNTTEQPSRFGRLATALAQQQAEKDRSGSVMAKPAETWRPDYERTGGHALEAPMVSPDDLIGTGIPSRIAGVLGAAAKGVAAKGGLLGAIPMAGVVRNKSLEQAAAKHFGKTFNPSETGFILDDGTRLDLSGRHYATGYTLQNGKYVPVAGSPDYLRGGRNTDHRELGDLVQGDGWDGLSEFMNQSGAMRYMPDTGISVVDTNMPSRAQVEKVVTDFRRSGMPLFVDVDTLNGNSRISQEFEKPTVDIVESFLRKNMKPEAFQ